MSDPPAAPAPPTTARRRLLAVAAAVVVAAVPVLWFELVPLAWAAPFVVGYAVVVVPLVVTVRRSGAAQPTSLARGRRAD